MLIVSVSLLTSKRTTQNGECVCFVPARCFPSCVVTSLCDSSDDFPLKTHESIALAKSSQFISLERKKRNRGASKVWVTLETAQKKDFLRGNVEVKQMKKSRKRKKLNPGPQRSHSAFQASYFLVLWWSHRQIICETLIPQLCFFFCQSEISISVLVYDSLAFLEWWAEHFGPGNLEVEVFNVGGWLTHGDFALEIDADFLAVTEHRLTPSRAQNLS